MKNIAFFLPFCFLFLLIACRNDTRKTVQQTEQSADSLIIKSIKSEQQKKEKQKRLDGLAKSELERIEKKEKVVFYYSSRKNDIAKMEDNYKVKRVNGKIYNYYITDTGTPITDSRVVLIWKKGDPIKITYSAW